jgi:hypothetical protein
VSRQTGKFLICGRVEIPPNQAPSQVETPFPLTRVVAPVFGRGHDFYGITGLVSRAGRLCPLPCPA